MKYLFIDGNNLGVRTAFANKELGIDLIDYSQDSFNPDDTISGEDHFPTGSIHGFFKTLNAIKRTYPDRYICVVWDGKSKARIIESKAAVEKGIVPEYYKENRKANALKDEIINFHKQRPVIMSALSFTNIPQLIKPDEEADDIIASLVEKLKGEDIIIYTNDQDYYQLFDDNVKILNASGNVLTEEWFRTCFGISPKQWVDVGGLAGDDGDSIIGVPWVGEGTGVSEIVKHASCENVLKAFHSEYDHLREKFPDLNGEDFKELKNIVTKNGKPKYPFVKKWMPFTGVALAYEKNLVKIPRTVIMCLVYESRIPLAKSLKAMRRNIKLPTIPVDLCRNKITEFQELCHKYQLNEISSHASEICARQIFD